MRDMVTAVFVMLLYVVMLAGVGVGVAFIRYAETTSHSAIHEIEGLICILIAVVAFGAATICSVLEKIYLVNLGGRR